MVERNGTSDHASRGLVFGLISLAVHAAARIYYEMQKEPPEPQQASGGLDALLSGFTAALEGIKNLAEGTSSLFRILQAADLIATGFAILGVAFAAIAGHRGDRRAVMWLAWFTSVTGLLLWAGRIPPGWVL